MPITTVSSDLLTNVATLDANNEVVQLPAGSALAAPGTVRDSNGAWVPIISESTTNNIALNSFRIAVNGSLSVQNMVDGFVDEYNDETGIAPTVQGTPLPKSLLHFTGTDGSTTFTDDAGKAWSARGAATIIGNQLSIPNGGTDGIFTTAYSDVQFDTGDFTIEWVFTSSTSSISQYILIGGTQNPSPMQILVDNLNHLDISINFKNLSTQSLVSTTAITNGVPHHLALVCNNSVYSLYVDGVMEGPTITNTSGIIPWNTELAIGARATSGLTGNYLLDEFRIIMGKALYTSNFTPPSVAFSYTTTAGSGSQNQVYDAVTKSYKLTPILAAPTRLPSAGATGANSSLFTNSSTTYTMSVNSTRVITITYPTQHTITSFSIIGDGHLHVIGTGTLEASNDGITWASLYSGIVTSYNAAAAANTGVGDVNVATPAPYAQYRFTATYSPSGTGFLTRIELNETLAGSTTSYIVSQPVTALTQPTTGNIIVFEEDIDAITLNTDLVASVSRDGGTTWTPTTLVDKGKYQNIKSVGINQVPTMTSPTAPSGIVTVSAETVSQEAFRAFDGSTTTGWSTTGASGWIAYDFQVLTTIEAYSMTSWGANTYYPKDWTFEGWDGTTWIILDTKLTQSSLSLTENTYYLPNPVSYTKYRLNFSTNNGAGSSGVSEMKLHGATIFTGKRILQGTANISTQPAGTSMQYKLNSANGKSLKIHGTSMGWK